jgi:hypothetical protein
VRRRLAVAVCLDAPCTVSSTATLKTTDRRRRVTRRRVAFTTLQLKADTAASLMLRLGAAQRRVIRAARSATIAVTVKADGRRVTKTFRFTVG